jgi:hypothetical protein
MLSVGPSAPDFGSPGGAATHWPSRLITCSTAQGAKGSELESEKERGNSLGDQRMGHAAYQRSREGASNRTQTGRCSACMCMLLQLPAQRHQCQDFSGCSQIHSVHTNARLYASQHKALNSATWHLITSAGAKKAQTPCMHCESTLPAGRSLRPSPCQLAPAPRYIRPGTCWRI